MTKFKHIKSAKKGGGVIGRVWKGNLLLTRVWLDQGWQVHPERKQWRLRSGQRPGWNSCWQNRKGRLESKSTWVHRCHASSWRVLRALSARQHTRARQPHVMYAEVFWMHETIPNDTTQFFSRKMHASILHQCSLCVEALCRWLQARMRGNNRQVTSSSQGQHRKKNNHIS